MSHNIIVQRAMTNKWLYQQGRLSLGQECVLIVDRLDFADWILQATAPQDCFVMNALHIEPPKIVRPHL
jgi:hypothetical protein